MANRSYSGFPLNSVIFGSRSTADFNVSQEQAPPVPYLNHHAAHTETALPYGPRRVYNDSTTTLFDERGNERGYDRGYESLTALPKFPKNDPPGTVPPMAHFELPPPIHRKKSVWQKIGLGVKRTFGRINIGGSSKPKIGLPTNFQHVQGVDNLPMSKSMRVFVDNKRAGLPTEIPDDDGNSVWEDVSEYEATRRI
ncbi:hypothetical protein BU24DRAFT_464557 [Aaosphaeria arxii CBS 175.79]|uniref:Uncharacterized protein n=1 Tax=Aaosphaeria arxii CBS 175.79 TaxID=1450172 RepID=A0A6A5XKN5_9PLEO|nr:uncharacterized protein BU24DRAFT_464557 [Aaosphaeria arxii CBS 175.79]KAF2013825.1 hypothetical protein BU24DRAFT_464557 [Aaosphaeria arxii CBS 175.79]